MLVKRNGGLPSLSSAFDDLFDMEKFFDVEQSKSQFVPAVNIKENDSNFEVELAVPGLSKSDFKVAIENRILNISAEKKDEKEDIQKNYTRREFSYNSFSRSFSLPDSVKEDDIEAKYNDGVLVNFKQNRRIKSNTCKKNSNWIIFRDETGFYFLSHFLFKLVPYNKSFS